MLDPASPGADEPPPPEGGARFADVTVAAAVQTGDRRRPTGAGWFSPLRVGVVVVLLVAALVAWDLTRGPSATYRTSVVGTGTVTATLDSVGTITPVDQADLAFNVSGTVSAVDVTVGQTVTAGETLASLDMADLNATVLSAQASLASAQASLASAEASQAAASTTSSKSVTTTTATPSSGSGGSATGGQGITQLQSTLVGDQSQLDADSTKAGVALQQATALCGNAGTSTPSTTSGSGITSGSGTTSGSGGGAGSVSSCSEALGQASAAQAAVAADVKQVGADERALAAALQGSTGTGAVSADSTAKAGTAATTSSVPGAAATPATTATAATPAAPATPAAGTGGSTSQGSSGQSTKKATPQQVAVDQASVDTAQAALADAQQALDGANLVSTITGTVGSVSMAVGDSVTAGSGSSSAQIVVIGTGSSYSLKTDVAVTDIGRVVIGQQALVTPDSTSSAVQGQVSAIGVVPTSGSTTTTYPVTISLDSPDLGQFSGVEGDVRIVTRRAVNVTTVPSSAVRTVGSVHLVTVVKDGTPIPTRVTLGTVGDVLTQVTSGVSRGQSVSLATLDQPLPSTTSTATRSGLGGLGGGGFGGGLGGGGFGGRFAG